MSRSRHWLGPGHSRLSVRRVASLISLSTVRAFISLRSALSPPALPAFEAWTSVSPSTIEIASYGSPKEIALMVPRLEQALPSAELHPLRQVMEAEVQVLGKTRSTLFAASALIILTSASCVLSTLIGWVFDSVRAHGKRK